MALTATVTSNYSGRAPYLLRGVSPHGHRAAEQRDERAPAYVGHGASFPALRRGHQQ
jgi:hypothetical protein